MSQFYDLLGVKVSVTNLKLACEEMEEFIISKKKTYICVAPVSTIVDCQFDDEYRDIVNEAGMVTPDGMPVVWVGQRRGYKELQRTYGPDLLPMFCHYAQDKGYSHYFYGGTEETLDLLEGKLKERFPNINIAGRYAPDFIKKGEREADEVINRINAANPDVIWVGLGSPKQDYWMKQHQEKLNASVLVGVGAAFDFIAGTKPQAPVWMRKCGLEWFFRFCSEPKRLWKRYIIGNSVFIYLLLKNWILPKGAGSRS